MSDPLAVAAVPPRSGLSPELEAVLRNSADALWITDTHGRLRAFNETFAFYCSAITGKEPALGMTLNAVVTRERRRELFDYWDDLISRTLQGRSLAAEGHCTLGGINHHFSITTSPVVVGAVVDGAAFNMRDITDYRRRKQHEFVELAMARIFSENASQQQTFSRVLETLCVATGWSVAIAWLIDKSGSVLEPSAWWEEEAIARLGPSLINERSRKGVGLPGNVWLTGRSVWIENVFDESELRRTPFLEHSRIRAAVAIPIKFGEEVLGVFEFFARTTRGVDKELLALLDELGEIVGRFLKAKQLEDDRTHLLELLERKGAEWTVTFDTIEAPIVVLDLRGTIVRLNRAARELTGAPFRVLIGRPITAAGDAGPWKLVRTAVRALVDSRQSVSMQMEDSDGRHWDIATSLYTSENSEENRVIVVFRDISDMIEMQNSVRRGEQLSAMGELVAGVAHEVRNPLFGISATLDTLDLILPAAGDSAELFGALRLWVSRLNDLMAQLLEYGKTWNINLVEGRLSEVVDTAEAMCGSLAAERNVTIVNSVRDLPPLRMDSTRLIQVFENLIRNSIDHAPNGRVELSARMSSVGARPMVECLVRDDGPGFPPEDLHRVFQPFFTRRRAGTGLGLSIVQRIVEEHGGQVIAENHPEGGALIRVLLPPTSGRKETD